MFLMQIAGTKISSVDVASINERLDLFLRGNILFLQSTSTGTGPIAGKMPSQGGMQDANASYSLNSDLLNFVLDYFPNPYRYFSAKSINALQELRSSLAGLGASQEQQTLKKWNQKNPNFSLEFKDKSSFFTLYSDISGYLGDKEKISTLAFWCGKLEQYYDKGKQKLLENLSPSGLLSYPPEKMLVDYSHSSPLGICGDINGSFLKKLATSMGLKHSSISVWKEEDNSGHVVGLIKTGDNTLYAVDYGKSMKLGSMKNPGIAAENLLSAFGGFKPFAFGYDRGTRFYRPPSEQLLHEVLNWSAERVQNELGVSILQNSSGGIAIKQQKNIENFNFGMFGISSPLSLKSASGAFLNYRSNKKEGFVWLPSLDFALFGSSTNFAAMLGAAPISFNWLPIREVEFSLTPLKIEGAHGTGKKIDFLASSSAGFIYKLDKFSQFYSSIDFGYCPNEERFYEFYSPEVAYRAKAGFMGESTQIEASYIPQGFLSRAEIDAKQNIPLGEGTNLVVFASVKYANFPSFGFGGQFTFNF